jgi:hypothetical protein
VRYAALAGGVLAGWARGISEPLALQDREIWKHKTMTKREPQLVLPGQKKDLQTKDLLRQADTVNDAFCLIFDTDEWREEQDRLTLRLPSRYTVVTCVPQQNGSVQFLTI